MKNSLEFGLEFFPTQQVPTFIFSRADFHSGDLVFLFRISALKFSGPGTRFFPSTVARRSLRYQLDASPNAPRGQIIRRKEPFAADEGQEGISDQSRHESCHVTSLGWQMKYFNLSCHLYLDAHLYSEVLLYMDIKWCGWPGLKQKVWFHVCLHAGSFCYSQFPQRRIWSSDIVEGWWQRQRSKFKGLFMLHRWAAGYVHKIYWSILENILCSFQDFPKVIFC